MTGARIFELAVYGGVGAIILMLYLAMTRLQVLDMTLTTRRAWDDRELLDGTLPRKSLATTDVTKLLRAGWDRETVAELATVLTGRDIPALPLYRSREDEAAHAAARPTRYLPPIQIRDVFNVHADPGRFFPPLAPEPALADADDRDRVRRALSALTADTWSELRPRQVIAWIAGAADLDGPDWATPSRLSRAGREAAKGTAALAAAGITGLDAPRWAGRCWAAGLSMADAAEAARDGRLDLDGLRLLASMNRASK